MPAFLIPLVIIFLITLFVTGGNIFKSAGDSFSRIQKEQEQPPSPSAFQKPLTPVPPAFVLDTSIVASPKEKELITDTNKVSVSPYFQKVTISSLSATTPSLITLKPNLKQGEEISITGWKIQGKAGSFQIPLGMERVNPFSSLQAGDLIAIKTGDTVYLSSGRGPFGLGKHFKPNVCMGYLKSSYTFPITVSSSCSLDKPQEKDLLFFLQACQDFIFKKIDFSSCAFPDYSKDITITADTQCTSYLTDLATGFTYNSCFARHADKSAFTANEWHVYMNIDLLTQRFDTIELLDQNGLLVFKKEYDRE